MNNKMGTSHFLTAFFVFFLFQGHPTLASELWANVAEDEKIFAEIVLPPNSSKEVSIAAQKEIMVSVFGKLSDPDSETAYYEYTKKDEFPIQMIPLAKEGWPVGTSLGGGGTTYIPADNKITLRIENKSPVELIVAIVVPK